MAYSTGFLNKRITIQNRKAATQGRYGIDGNGAEWEDVGQMWASVDYAKGKRAMNEGALDVYAVVMVRCRYTDKINERSRIIYQGRTYQILGETLHVDYQPNTIQFQAQVLINDQPAPEPPIPPSPSCSEI